MSSNHGKDDALLPSVRAMVLETQDTREIFIQRKFDIGYARAGRMIDALEDEGVVGQYNGSHSRQVLRPAPGA